MYNLDKAISTEGISDVDYWDAFNNTPTYSDSTPKSTKPKKVSHRDKKYKYNTRGPKK